MRRITMSKQILFVSGHTHMKDSLANKTILDDMKAMYPQATFDYLTESYPDFAFDVAKEQAKLEAADVIVIEYPMFWFNAPSIVQRWFEEVFLYGFAYGTGGDKLQGKTMIVSLTSGAPEEVYTADAAGTPGIESYLLSMKATAAYTGMKWGGFIYSGGMMSIGVDEATKQALTDKAKDHAKRLQALIASVLG